MPSEKPKTYYYSLLHNYSPLKYSPIIMGHQSILAKQIPSSFTSTSTHTVANGDTSVVIAQKPEITLSQLEAANAGINFNNLRIGQSLQVLGDALAPQSPPSAPTPSSTSTYTVVSGDTGLEIAQRLNITLNQLEAANAGINLDNLQIGQVLQIPGNQSYTVIAGDTAENIANKFEISVSAIEAANPNTDWNNLQVGQILSIPSASSGTSLPPATQDDSGTEGGGPVIQYSGPASNFPPQSQWQKWSLMWAHAVSVMQINDNADEINDMEDSINAVSQESGIDRRVILSVIMEECSGNVNAVATPAPGSNFINPGIMQSHNGVGFDSSNPSGSILQMIKDGTEGTTGPNGGDGLVQVLAQYGNIYEALRAYNSGSVDSTDLNNGFLANPSYVSDLANR
jgi:LysM repeat protein